MSATMTQKILARAAGEDHVSVGEAMNCQYDCLSLLDIDISEWIDEHDLKVRYPEKVVICFDHFLDHSMGKMSAVKAHPKIREFIRRQGIPASNVFDVGRTGISHHVPIEEGFVYPGTFCATHDTQGATLGAGNAFAVPLMWSVVPAVVTGDAWIVVPEALRIRLQGRLRDGLTGKDVYLRLLGELREHATDRVLEYEGPGLETLPISARLAIANGSNHMGAVTSIFPADRVLLEYLESRVSRPVEPVHADEDAEYAGSFDFDLDTFEPVVSGPGDIAALKSLTDVAGKPVQAAFIGSCNSASLDDLRLAAREIGTRRIHPSVRMVVTPLSTRVMRAAAEEGLIAQFIAAGATVTMPGCGACYVGNQSPLKLDDGEVCISTSVENYAGRMGSEEAEIYLGNPAVVAASAVAGQITYPGVLS